MHPRMGIRALQSSRELLLLLSCVGFPGFPWFLGRISSFFPFALFICVGGAYYLVASQEKMYIQVLACLKLSLFSPHTQLAIF